MWSVGVVCMMVFFFLGQKATTDFRPDTSDKNYTFDDVQGVSLLFLFPFPSVPPFGRWVERKNIQKNLHAGIAPIMHYGGA